MKDENGYRLTAPELVQFCQPAIDYLSGTVPGPVVRTLWTMNMETGVTSVEPTEVPDGSILLMTGPDPDWVAQWGSDFQRACDEQLNPLLVLLNGSTP